MANVKEIKRNGRSYFYFNPPASMPWMERKRLRAESRAEAEAEARRILRPGAPGERARILEVTKAVIRKARSRAARRGLAFEVTEEDAEELLSAQEWRCAVSGMPFTLDNNQKAYRRPFAPSLDQIRPGAGYARNNVRLVTVAVNVALGQWGQEQLLTVARAIAKTADTTGLSWKTTPLISGKPESSKSRKAA